MWTLCHRLKNTSVAYSHPQTCVYTVHTPLPPESPRKEQTYILDLACIPRREGGSDIRVNGTQQCATQCQHKHFSPFHTLDFLNITAIASGWWNVNDALWSLDACYAAYWLLSASLALRSARRRYRSSSCGGWRRWHDLTSHTKMHTQKQPTSTDTGFWQSFEVSLGTKSGMQTHIYKYI